MHATTIRRQLGPKWRHFSTVAVISFLTAFGLMLASGRAHAELDVSVVNIERQSSYASLRVYAGRTVAARAAQLGFKRGGEVDTMSVDIGDVVEAGQLLASLDRRTLQSMARRAAAEVTLAKANLGALVAETELAQNTEARFRRLRESGHASKQVYDEARLNLRAKEAQRNVAHANLERASAAHQAAQVELDEALVTAPFAGIIQTRYVDEGSQISSGAPVLRLVERERSEAHIGIPAELGERLTRNNVYPVRWNDKTYDAILAAVLPEVDTTTRTLTAVFRLNENAIPLGSVVELRVSEQVPAPGFWLPLSALTASDRGLWGVYVVNDQNSVERRLVEIVHSEADRVFVRGTLDSNDRVVKTGVQRIVPGQIVNVSPTAQVSYAR